MNTYPRKVLFVAMLNSIHTTRWLSQFVDEKIYDIHLFSSVECSPHPMILKNKLYTIHVGDLEEVINNVKPDIIHTLEMQHSAYLVLPIRKKNSDFPLWFYSCWGSDIRWFSKYREDKKKIGEVLSYIDALFSEDIESIQKAINLYHYKKPYLQVQGPGGFKVDEIKKMVEYIPPSKRKIITVKGYVGWVYRPETVFSALELCSDLLKQKGYKIVIYAADGVEPLIKTLKEDGVDIELFRWTPNYNDVLVLFSKARINIASSLSDGIPNTMLEGMIVGAFPIQSKSKPIANYIKNYKNGILLDPLDVKGFAKAIKKTLTDDNLVDKAAVENFNLIKTNLDYDVLKKEVLDFYESFFKEVNNSSYLYKLNKFYWVTLGRKLNKNVNILGSLIRKVNKVIMFDKIKKINLMEIFHSKNNLKDFCKKVLCKINPVYRKVAVIDSKINNLNSQLGSISEKLDLIKKGQLKINKLKKKT